MSQISIAQLAELSGFPSTTIRFYENNGVLPRSSRGPNGYRVYTPRDVERLRFVSRAKRMGLDLDEIRVLVGFWDDRTPAETGAEAVDSIRNHLSDVARLIAELSEFSAQLEEALENASAASAETGEAAV